MQNGRNTGINAALISALFLGLAPVFGKAAMGEGKFSPLAVVALRTSLAALLLVILIVFSKRRTLYIYPAGFLGCMLAGAVNGFGSIFYYVGLSKLNASVAQMLYALYPFFVAFWLQLDQTNPFQIDRIPDCDCCHLRLFADQSRRREELTHGVWSSC